MILNKWHDRLDMAKHDKAWHEQDMRDELEEYASAHGRVMKWSELSDVVYTYTRARWGGYDLDFPFSKLRFALGVIYMVPKYSMRFRFYKKAGQRTNSGREIHEVRNPKKVEKLHKIAEMYDIDAKDFQRVCDKQLKYWVLLP